MYPVNKFKSCLSFGVRNVRIIFPYFNILLNLELSRISWIWLILAVKLNSIRLNWQASPAFVISWTAKLGRSFPRWLNE